MSFPAGKIVFLSLWLIPPVLAEDQDSFRRDVAPILEQHCVRCHNGKEGKGDVDLSSKAAVVDGLVVPGQPDESYLLEVVTGEKPRMPKSGERLTNQEIAGLRRWIKEGADWPENVVLKYDPLNWWSLKPLTRQRLPDLSAEGLAWARTPIDAFVFAKLREMGMMPSPEADRRTLIRRLSFDLTGLPPTFEEVEQFVRDEDPQAYERVVDRLLASPPYGERWARHWLDAVHYGDTHGYDKDKVRPHAWPYRDYVIRSLNEDKPYSRFVKEQLAGDAFYPGTADGIAALGFIVSGPFDYVGQIEVKNGTLEKNRVKNIDRDDMVSVTMNTFVSLTVHCARCHDHKFDPITQEDYYSLQAVFAAVDRADRPFDADPEVASRRRSLQDAQRKLTSRKSALVERIQKRVAPKLEEIDRRLAELTKQVAAAPRPEFGYHSQIMPGPDHAKWVQVDLGRSLPIGEITLLAAYDDFAGIGAGFGFPERYRLEISDDPDFHKRVVIVGDKTAADVPNPGLVPQTFSVQGQSARYVRLTATKLRERRKDYIFALAEMKVLAPQRTNLAAGAKVSALDSIEAPVRWRKTNLVDGIYRGADKPETLAELKRLKEQRDSLLKQSVDEPTRQELAEVDASLKHTADLLKALPPQSAVYAAATDFERQGNFVPTEGEPRPIFVLGRGDEKSPLYEIGPGTVSCIPELPSRFSLDRAQAESARRVALAEWIVASRNPLTWRSIVNRVWSYHFGRGIVETPNDFGRMGQVPTHPELLDWLAIEFRDGRQSLKGLHRMIVTSAAYRQSSADNAAHARIDAGNRFLWRMNRKRLEAEAIRDAVLAAAGKLRHEMGGPGFRTFGFKDDHSPHYKYREHDPEDPDSQRRSIYRFAVRSVPDPFMTVLDCADPSLIVARRSETLTPLQALALLNNKFMVRMAEHFASRGQAATSDVPSQVRAVWRIAFQREPRVEELAVLVPLAEEHSLVNVCRLIFNANEFIFID